MKVKELKEYLSQFPDDMEVLEHHRDSCYSFKKIKRLIYPSNDYYMEVGNIEGGETKLIIDVSL